MISLLSLGHRICGALLLSFVMSMPTSAQDLRLPLQLGQPDLALYALSRSEDRISDLGQALLSRQGFLHRADGPALQSLTSGHSLVPTVRHDPNINDGIPADRITLGSLPFVVAPESRAKDGVLLGLQFSRWQSWSYSAGARLRLSHGLAAELEPTHGFHHGAAHLRLCVEQPAAAWTWADSCIAAGLQHDGRETTSALTASFGARHLFQTAAGFHQFGSSFSTTGTDDYGKDMVQLSHQLLTKGAGMWSFGYTWGEEVAGQNTLRRRLSLEWSGEVAGKVIGLSLSETRTAGAMFFGAPRAEHKVRVGLTVPVGQFDLGGWIGRSGSTIDAYRGTDMGLTIGFRISLL